MEARAMLNCTNPQYIYNKYSEEYKYVPCGRCEACIVHKQRSMSMRCQLETTVHKYCMFVTLTYDNDHIPLAYPLVYQNIDGTYNISLFNSCIRLHKYYGEDEILSDSNMDPQKFELLLKKFNMNGMIPYLSKHDEQNFLKRFRKNLHAATIRYYRKRLKHSQDLLDSFAKHNPNADKSNFYDRIKFYSTQKPEKIRYYCCGELGPKHFRPHFHFLFWFDNQVTLAQFGESLRKSWTYGRIDYSISRGDAASYTASYINSTVYLPEIFNNGRLRPKSYHSQQLGEKIFPCPHEKIQEHDHIGAITTCVPLNGNNTRVRMWRSLTSRIMPLCKGYNQKTDVERLYTYTIYDKITRWTGEISPYLCAKQLTDLIIRLGFDTPEVYKYCKLNEPEYLLDIIRYFYTSLHVDSCKYDPSDGCLSSIRCAFCIYEIDFKHGHYKFVDHSGYRLYDFLLQSIYRELRVSRDFCQMQSHKGYYYYNKSLDLINSFYSVLEIDKMNANYRNMEELLNQELATTEDLYMYYTNIDFYQLYIWDMDVKRRLRHTPIMRLTEQKAKVDFQRSIKHKVQNDANKIFIYNSPTRSKRVNKFN